MEKAGAYLTVFLFQFVVEDQKFALFNFVNDQNNEADILKEQISQVGICLFLSFILIWLKVLFDEIESVNLKIRAEIQHFQAKRVQKEKDNGSFLADIEGKIAKLRSQAEDYEKQACVIDELLGNVKTGEETIF